MKSFKNQDPKPVCPMNYCPPLTGYPDGTVSGNGSNWDGK